MRIEAAALSLLLSIGAASPLAAQELRIGLAIEPTSLDPHFNLIIPDEAIARHFYDSLVLQDDQQRMVPGLAISWRSIDSTTWEFRLRPNVHFINGDTFGAEDVVASLKRAPNVPNSLGGYALYTKGIAEVELVDPLTVRIHTRAPDPILPDELSIVSIVSRRCANATTEAFDGGTSAIGTGPFRLVHWIKGQEIVMERNDRYWGGKAEWQRVTDRVITADAARVAALYAGDVDLIDTVPSSVLDEIEARPGLSIARVPSSRAIYLHLDSFRDRSPFVTDGEGQPLDPNPLRDGRVRAALSLAIDRIGLVRQILNGAGTPAAQILPQTGFGASPRLKPDPFDPTAARRLLAEAGYPQGFRISLHASSTFSAVDQKVAVAIGGMLERIGIATDVVALPDPIYRSRARNYEFSLMLLGWHSETAEASSWLRAIVATPDPAHALGYANRGRYSNPALDDLLGEAATAMNEQARRKLLEGASELAIEDHAVIPLYFADGVWAFRDGLSYRPRADLFTLAHDVTERR